MDGWRERKKRREGEEEGFMFGIGSKYGGSEERGPDPDRDPASPLGTVEGKVVIQIRYYKLMEVLE